MKKIILLFVTMLLLTSCNKVEYNIEYTLCNWWTWSVIHTYDLVKYNEPYISTYKQAVPILNLWAKEVLNVCDFKIISEIERE